MIKPIPCVAFRHADISDWMDKLQEETEEVIAIRKSDWRME